MFNVRTLSIILAVIMVFGLASLAFAQSGTGTGAGAGTATAGASAAATSTATGPSTLPTTGGTAAGWMLPLMAFVVLFLVAGMGLNLARRAR
jgi:hypothetical protein